MRRRAKGMETDVDVRDVINRAEREIRRAAREDERAAREAARPVKSSAILAIGPQLRPRSIQGS